MSQKELEIIKGWLEKLGEFDIENVISYHNGLYKDHPNQKIKELSNSIK